MKSEERHQLEQNDLAQYLAKSSTAARPYLPIIGGVVAILAVGAVGINYWNQQQEAQSRAAWGDFLAADQAVNEFQPQFDDEESQSVYEFGADRFSQVAAEYAGSEVGARAALRAADYRFEFSKTLLLRDRGQAITKLTEVVSEYSRIAGDASLSDDVRRQAMFGKAMAQETMGALADARGSYEQIADRYDAINPSVASQARRRLERLNDDRVKQFYAMLEDHKPAETSVDLPPMEGAGDVPLPPMSDDSPLDIPIPPFDLEKTTPKAQPAEEPKAQPETKEDASKADPEPKAEPEPKADPEPKAESEPKDAPESKEESAPKEGAAEKTDEPKAAEDDKKAEPAEKPESDNE